MKLVASIRAAELELDRYLPSCISHLEEFCDGIVLVCEDPDETLWGHRLGYAFRAAIDTDFLIIHHSRLRLYDHEGRARQELVDLTIQSGASHVLAIDADEFVADGATVRAACLDPSTHWSLCMQEVWDARANDLGIRQDGGWEEHDVTMLWAPGHGVAATRIADRALACGRVPDTFKGYPAACTGTSVLHFGWANRAERNTRAQRYADHDGGRFHASTHLDSILWPDDRVVLTRRPWPVGWTNRRRAAILHNAAREGDTHDRTKHP